MRGRLRKLGTADGGLMDILRMYDEFDVSEASGPLRLPRARGWLGRPLQARRRRLTSRSCEPSTSTRFSAATQAETFS